MPNQSAWSKLKQTSAQNKQNWNSVQRVVEQSRAVAQAAQPAPTFSTSPGPDRNAPLYWDASKQTFDASKGTPMFYDPKAKAFTTYKTAIPATLGMLPADPSENVNVSFTPPEAYSPALKYGGLSRAALGNLDVAGAIDTLTSEQQKQYAAEQITESTRELGIAGGGGTGKTTPQTRTVQTPSRTPGGAPTYRTVPVTSQDLMMESDKGRVEVHGYKNMQEVMTAPNSSDWLIDVVGLIFGGAAKGVVGKTIHNNPGLGILVAFPYALATSMGSTWSNLVQGDPDRVRATLVKSGLTEEQINQVMASRKVTVDATTGRILDEEEQQIWLANGKGVIPGMDENEARQKYAAFMWDNARDIVNGDTADFENLPEVSDMRGRRGGVNAKIVNQDLESVANWKMQRAEDALMYRRQAERDIANVDSEGAIQALVQAHDAELDASNAIYDPAWGFTWPGEPDRKVAFERAWAEAEIQLGRNLNNIELRMLRDRFVNNTTEFIGETAVDVTNYISLGFIGKALSMADDVLLNGATKVAFRAFASPFKSAAAVSKAFFKLEGAEFAAKFPDWATRIGSNELPVYELARRRDMLGRTLTFIKNAQRPAIASAGVQIQNTIYDIGIRLARGVQTVDQLKQTFETFARSTVDPKVALPKSVGPRDTARIMRLMGEIFSPSLGKGIHDPHLRALRLENWGTLVDDAVTELQESALKGFVSADAARSPDIVMRHVANKFRTSFIASHAVADLNVLDDTIAAYVMRAVKLKGGKTLADTDSAVKFVGAIIKGGEFLKGLWAYAVLAGRPAWTFINTIDTTARYLLGGGKLFDDLGAMWDPKGVARVMALEGVPGANMANMMGTVTKEGDTVAERLLLMGGRRLEDGGGLLDDFYDLFSGTIKEIERTKKFGGLLGKVEVALRIGPGMVADYNSAMEFVLRTRLFHKQFKYAHTILDLAAKDESFRILTELGGSPELDGMMRRLWDYSEHNAEKFNVIASSLLGGKGSKMSKNWAAFFPSGDTIARNFGEGRVVLRESLLSPAFEHVSRRIDEFIGIGGKVTEENLDVIFDEVRTMLDDLVKQYTNERAVKEGGRIFDTLDPDLAKASRVAQAGQTMPDPETIENMRLAEAASKPEVSIFKELDPALRPSTVRQQLTTARRSDIPALFKGAVAGSADVVEDTTIKGLHEVLVLPDGKLVIKLNPKLLGKGHNAAAIRVELQNSLFDAIEKKLGPILPEDSLIQADQIAYELRTYALGPAEYRINFPDKLKWIEDNVSGVDANLTSAVHAVRGEKRWPLDALNPAMKDASASFMGDEADALKAVAAAPEEVGKKTLGFSADYRVSGEAAASAKYEMKTDARALMDEADAANTAAQAGDAAQTAKGQLANEKVAYINRVEDGVTLFRDRTKKWLLESVYDPLSKQGAARRTAWNNLQDAGKRLYDWSAEVFTKTRQGIKFVPAGGVPKGFESSLSSLAKKNGIDIEYGVSKTINEWLEDPAAGMRVGDVFKNTYYQKIEFLQTMFDDLPPGNMDVARLVESTPYMKAREEVMAGGPAPKPQRAKQAPGGKAAAAERTEEVKAVADAKGIVADAEKQSVATAARVNSETIAVNMTLPPKAELVASGMSEAEATAHLAKMEVSKNLIENAKKSSGTVAADIRSAQIRAAKPGVWENPGSRFNLWEGLSAETKTHLIADAGSEKEAKSLFFSYVKPRETLVPTPLETLRAPHPDQARIDAESAALLRSTAEAPAQVPFMITQDMKARLRALGVTDDEIKAMTPTQAWERLKAAPVAEAAQAAPTPKLPSWLQDEIDRRYAIAEKAGIVEDIRRMALEGKTAGEIGTELGTRVPGKTSPDRREIIRAVRNKLGIPSAEPGEELEALKAMHAAAAKPVAEAAPKVVSDVDEVNAATRKYFAEATEAPDPYAADFLDEGEVLPPPKPAKWAMKLNEDLTQKWDEATQAWVPLSKDEQFKVATVRSEAVVRSRQSAEHAVLSDGRMSVVEAHNPTLAREWDETLEEMDAGVNRGANGTRNYNTAEAGERSNITVGQGEVSTYELEGAEWYARQTRKATDGGTGRFAHNTKAQSQRQIRKAIDYIKTGTTPKANETAVRDWMAIIHGEAMSRMFPKPVFTMEGQGLKSLHEILPPTPAMMERWGMMDEDYLFTHPDAQKYLSDMNAPPYNPLEDAPLIVKPLDPAETSPEIVAAQAAHNKQLLLPGKPWQKSLWDNFITDKPPGRANSLVEMFGVDAATPEGLRIRIADSIEMMLEKGMDESHPMVQAMREIETYVGGWRTINGQVDSLMGVVPTRMPARVAPVGYSLKDMPAGARQVLFGLQDDGVSMSAAYRFVDDWRNEAKEALRAGMPGFNALSDVDKTVLGKWLDGAARAKQNATDVAINGSGDVVLPQLGRWEGAIAKTNHFMLDYTAYSKADRIMKQIFPFWMFPSRSLGMWSKEIVQHPAIAGFYYRYYRWSVGELYNAGAVTSDGKPLARLRGYMRIPGTNMWINPLAPLSASVILRAVMDIGKMEDAADMEQMDDDGVRNALTWMYKIGRLYGFSPGPWITLPLIKMGKLDPEQSFNSLIPQLELMPPWTMRSIAEHALRIKDPDKVKAWGRETPWQDSLIEVRMLGDALLRIKAATSEADKEAIVQEVKNALANREKNDLWEETRYTVEASQYYSKLAGFFTGFYAKEWSDAEAELKLQVRDLNAAREAINSEMKASIFGYDPDPVKRYFDYSNLRYDSLPGQVAGLYNNLRYVKLPDGNPARGEERRQLIQKGIHDDEVSGAYYDTVAVAYEEYNAALRKIPIGDTEGRKRQRDLLYAALDVADNAPMFGDAKKPWSIGYKPEELVYDKFQSQWWETLRRTQPYWNSADGETWDEYQMEMKQWLMELPQIAQDMVPFFMTSTIAPYFDATEAGRGLIKDFYGNTTRAMDLKKLTDELLAESTPEGWDLYDKAHDTEHDALNKAWQELYWNPYWEAVGSLTGYDRQIAEVEFKKRFPNPPSTAELAKWVMDNYPDGKFTPEMLLNAVKPTDQPPVKSVEERLAPTTETAAMSDEVWDWLAWAGPSKTALTQAYVKVGGDSGDIDTFYNTSGMWGNLEDPRAKAGFKAFHDLLGVAVQSLGLTQPSEPILREMAEAKRLNEMLNASVEETLGPGIWGAVSEYGQLTSRAARNEIKAEHPELKVYWAMKDEFEKAYPMWAKYYVMATTAATSGGTGGGSGGGKSKGGGGGGSKAAPVVEMFQPMGKRSTMNAADYMKKGIGGGGRTSKPTWPKGFAALVGPTLGAEIVAKEDVGKPISPAGVDALKGIAKRHPEYGPFISSLRPPGASGGPQP